MNKYLKLYNQLVVNIKDGLYQPGEYLPFESELMESFSLSRETVRNALKLLQNNGFIEKIKGKGSRVIYQPAITITSDNALSFNKLINGLQEYSTKVYRVHSCLAKDLPDIQKLLELRDHQKIWHVVRMRYINQQPMIIDEDFLIADMIPDLDTLVETTSLYNYLTEHLHLNIDNKEMNVSIQPMNPFEFTFFDDVYPMYVLELKVTALLDGEIPIMYRHSKYHPHHFKYIA